jgi:RNA polymerase sigma factor (sigma-70 family)
MIGICYRYTSDRQLSEDLAHDAFLKAIAKSADFKGTGSFDAWLRRIVVNHALQYIRDQKNRGQVDDRVQYKDYAEPSTDTSAGHADFSEQELLDVINQLPTHHRLVFNLYVIDRFTHVQIGEELGISPGTSKSHLARARKKLRDLLAQDLREKRDKKDRKRGWLLFFLSGESRSIDELYRKQFDGFTMTAKKIIPSHFDGIPTPAARMPLTTLRKYAMMTTSVGIIVAVAVIIHNFSRQNPANTFESELRSANEVDTTVAEMSFEELNKKSTSDRKTNSTVTGSNAATFRQDSVIPNKKQKGMKKLDSIGAMLLVSSSIMFDSTAQSNQAVHADSQIIVLADTGSATTSVTVNQAVRTNAQQSKTNEGTFYASQLFWSGTDHELYFKGKVIAHMNDQDFIVDGSVNFLGPVYLLIINDEQATIDSTIKLSKQQYRLIRLSDKEAAQKYGEKGKRGAIEISVM